MSQRTVSESRSIAIADRFIGNKTPLNKRIKKLAEEVTELAMALQQEEYEGHIDEEFGDCIFILVHMASIYNPEKTFVDYLFDASHKMKCRKLEKSETIISPDGLKYTVLGVSRETSTVSTMEIETREFKTITFQELKKYAF